MTQATTLDAALASGNALLDAIIVKMQLKNDAALARLLGVAAPVVSKIRHGVLRITANMMIRIYDAAGLSILEQRNIMNGAAK